MNIKLWITRGLGVLCISPVIGSLLLYLYVSFLELSMAAKILNLLLLGIIFLFGIGVFLLTKEVE